MMLPEDNSGVGRWPVSAQRIILTGLANDFGVGAGFVLTGVMHTAHQISTTGQHFGYVFYFHITELMTTLNQAGEEFIFGQYLFELTENDRCEGMSVNDAARR